jgi:hypothetical protein
MLPSRARRSGPSVGLAAPVGRERNFSSPQAFENKRNRIGIPPNPPPFGGRRCEVRLAGSKKVATPRPSSASFAGNRRGGRCEAAKFSYPQTLEKARNGEGISSAVASCAGSRRRSGGTPRPTPAVSSLRVVRRPLRTRNDGGIDSVIRLTGPKNGRPARAGPYPRWLEFAGNSGLGSVRK